MVDGPGQVRWLCHPQHMLFISESKVAISVLVIFQPEERRKEPREFMPNPSKTSITSWTSLVAQWLRICLPMQGIRVWALVLEDPTCRGATNPGCHNYWACAPGPVNHNYWAHVPQLLKPTRLESLLCNKEKLPQWEGHALQWRVGPTRCNYRKPACSNEEPTSQK